MYANILSRVLKKIKPREEERRELSRAAEGILERVRVEAGKTGLDVRGILVGSSARGTWVSGEHDLDVFLTFPEETTREELERIGLSIARKVAEGARWEERYAEHPYIHAFYDGYEVDLVPCFRVERASQIKSSVDRTPFHNEYISKNIKGLEDEVLLLKQFMKGRGVYGSELKTHGFSGYLTELLIIYYRSFIEVLKAASTWKPGLVIDMGGHGNVAPSDPLVMVDPTDPARNVAAALSIDQLGRFIDSARGFLESPAEEYFFPNLPSPLGDEELKIILKSRGTTLIAIIFDAPDIVEDILFPQLRKMEQSVGEMIHRHDFKVFRSDVYSNKQAVILFELEVSRLPEVKKHIGPPFWNKEHSGAFKAKYSGAKIFSSIYIKDGRYIVEIPRKYVDAKNLVKAEVLSCGLGKHVANMVRKGYQVLENEEILAIKDRSIRVFLREYFS